MGILDAWNWTLKGWRTVIFSGLAAILPILQLTELKNVIPMDWLPWYELGVILIYMLLRKVSTTPMGRRM